MTRQVRLYEDDAKLIDLILATKPRGVTFADVIRPALRDYYEGVASRAHEVIGDIEDGIPTENTAPADNRTKRNAG